ncbi:hypothetical protein [Novosphingobium sp. BW1]|uniref:hypothetical protein n=1 Tax=Novosphingobium sp. BW1 TaxID=2592621 RepID=UPI0011DE7965|nr:hypothetical protein [Novosphingobium sp. BW1]TYC91549.1 hypothetical protein FMM79_04675 [Novosphingobium sp. BW1]
MTGPASHDRHGSNAGRGFRFQDAVAAWLAVRVWAGDDEPTSIIPEGNDDIERREAEGSGLVQVKSRREHMGETPIATARDYVKDLWTRHDKFTPNPRTLELILERPIADHLVEADSKIIPNTRLKSMLPGGARGEALLSKTMVQHIPEPHEAAIARIAEKTGCTPLAAQICFAQLLVEIGSLSNQNGRLKPPDYRGLSATDTERLITATLETADIDAIEQAIIDGACEPVDFLTPLDDAEFYLGVDVQAGHVVAGLVVPRVEPEADLARGLESRRAAMVVGPSGAGKSAIMWRTAYSLRHTIRWYGLLRIEQRDLPALRRLLRALRASADAPVGFVVDDIGRRGTEGWDALTREFLTIPGALLLGSIREEDLFLLEGRARVAEIRAEPDKDLAKRIFDELKRTGKTQWSGWREPWALSEGLVLEYTHILSAGERFEQTLSEQVDARLRDQDRATELAILRIVALAGAAGAAVDVRRLPAVLTVSADDIARGLRRLVEEHLVRDGGDSRLTGLHQLRSAELFRLTHREPPPFVADTFAQAVRSMGATEIEPLLADAVRRRGLATADAVSVIAELIEQSPDIATLSAALRGLGTVRISTTVDRWLAAPEVVALPRTQIGTAMMLSYADTSLADINENMALATKAGAQLAALRADYADDPRTALLEALPDTTVSAMFASAADVVGLDQLLSSLMGLPLHPKLGNALTSAPTDLLEAPFEPVVRLLGSMVAIDRARAIAWVDDAGAEPLAVRIPASIPWAAHPVFEEAPEGTLIRVDHYQLGIPGTENANDEVVRLCEAGLALSPRSEIAASSAILPNGEKASFSGHNLAEKRIPRANLPPAALPAWNRLWGDAIGARIGSPSQTAYLASAAQLLDRLVPALQRVIDTILIGKNVSDALLVATNAVHDAARELTPPNVAAVGGAESTRSIHVTPLQNVLFAASTEVIRDFHQLPGGAAASISRINGLIENIDEAGANEAWHLVGGVPASLGRLREMMVTIRNITGDVAEAAEHPGVKHRALLGKARPNNALRLLGTRVAATIGAARARLAKELKDALANQGITAEVRALEAPDAIVPWPPSEMVVLIPIDRLEELESFEIAANVARAAAHEYMKLTAIPVVGGRLASTWGKSGYSTMVNLFEDASKWAPRLGISAYMPIASSTFDSVAASAASLQSMDRLGLGIEGRATAEVETRAALEAQLVSGRAELASVTTALGTDLAEAAANLVDEIRFGDVNFIDVSHSAVNGGEIPQLLVDISLLRIVLDQAEIDATMN